MPIVQLEDGTKLQFDDNYNEEQIGQAVDEYMSGQVQPMNENQAPAQPQSNIDKRKSELESFVTGAGQGATANFGDEIIAGLSTPVIYGGSRLAEKFGYDTKGLANKSFAQTYRDEQVKNQNEVRAAEAANPKTFLAGNVAGSIATAVKAAPTKVGNMTAKYLASGSLPMRALKAAPLGFATGALAGAGAADSDKIGQESLKSGATGAVISAALPFVGAAVNKGINKFTSKAQPIPTSEQVTDLSRQAYKEADATGGVLKSNLVDDFADGVQKMTRQTEFGKLLDGDSPLTKLSEKIALFKGKNMSLEAAQEVDEALSNQIDRFVDKTTGKVTKEGLEIQKVQDAFRKIIDDATESDVIGGKDGFNALKKGRALWSNAARLRDVEKIITRAEMTDNPATAIKTGFRNFFNNPSRMRGLDEEEKKLVKKAAESGFVSDTLRTLGSRLIPIGSAIAGNGVAGTVAAQAGSIAARGAAAKMQVGRAQELARKVASKAIPTPAQTPRFQLLNNYPLLNPAISASGAAAGVSKNNSSPQNEMLLSQNIPTESDLLNRRDLTPEQILNLMVQQNQTYSSGAYTPEEMQDIPDKTVKRYYRGNKQLNS